MIHCNVLRLLQNLSPSMTAESQGYQKYIATSRQPRISSQNKSLNSRPKIKDMVPEQKEKK